MDAAGAVSLASVAFALPHGITLRGFEAGRGRARRMLCVHGFPEGPFVWDDLLAALAGDVHGVAPALRGYSPSSMPLVVANYRPRHLVADLEACIEQIGAPLDLLVAHDWGGALAWNLAASRPDLLRHLLIINAPHPATFLRELRDNPAQQRASEYMRTLCGADAEALLARDDFAMLWPLFGAASWLTPALQERYRSTWSAGLAGALNYYRASPLRPPSAADDALHQLRLPPELLTLAVPTTVLWGEQDHALLPALLGGLEQFVPQLRLVRVPDASHWLVHERPGLVLAEVRRALGLA